MRMFKKCGEQYIALTLNTDGLTVSKTGRKSVLPRLFLQNFANNDMAQTKEYNCCYVIFLETASSSFDTRIGETREGWKTCDH